MKVTGVLLRFKKALPGGHIWKGKHRLYKKVTPLHVELKKREFEVEERNMFYLRNPYLTPEQSVGFVNYKDCLYNEKMKLKKPFWRYDKFLGDRFGFLKVTDKWE